MLGAGAYLLGAAGVVLVVAALAVAARSARRALLPGWEPAPAALAEIVLGLALLLGCGQLAGSLRLLRPWPVLALVLVAAAATRAVSRRLGSDGQGVPDTAPSPPRAEVAVAAGAAAVVVVQWASHAGDALRRGMTHADTLWYHQPFAARFVQEGAFVGLDGLGYSAARWFPFDSQLLHALAILPFHRDVLSPFLNVGWALLALLAAWCIGRRAGAPHVSLVGAAIVLGLPVLAGTQPGQASSDVACAALLLAAVALLLEGGLAPGPLAVAGLAAGLAIGTKVTMAVPVGVLAVGVVAVALARRRPRPALVWAGAVAATGAYWFLRNWVGTGTPLPWFDIEVGPVSMPAEVHEVGTTFASKIGDGGAWRDVYLPGLSRALGRGWPVVLALAVTGGLLAIVRGRRPLERLAGVVVLAGMAGYTITPLTGGFSFVFNLRYLTPVLLVGLALLPRLLPGDTWRRVALGVGAVLVAVGAAASHHERVPAWPAGVVLPAAVVVLLAAGGAALVARTVGPQRTAAAALLVGLAVGGGWPAQRHYLSRRYVDAGLHMDEVHDYFRGVRDARVAVFGTDETLPMFGLDLSNEVRRGDEPGFEEGPDPCRSWRRELGGRFDYIVLTRFGFSLYLSPPEDVIASDPAATEVVRQGDSVAYRLDGPLDPAACG